MERRGWRQRASLRGGGLRGTASPARVGAPWKWRRGLHSQEKSPRCSTARAANGAMEPGLQLGSPSVRNGSGESYPDPSETKKKGERQKATKPLNLKGTCRQRRDSLQAMVGVCGGGGPQKDQKYKKRQKEDVRKGCGEEGRRRRR